ncbi:MAG: glycosyltransferase family 87 protein [Phycisphaerae bacterium]
MSIILVVGLIITIVAAFQARARVLHREKTGSTHYVNDFDRWMVVVPPFIQHHVPYTSDTFPTPPFTLAIFGPLTWFSPPNAEWVWALCKYVFCIGIFWAVYRMTQQAGVKLSLTAILLILAVWLWPVLGDIQEGQTNLLMLLPLALGLCAAQLDAPGWKWTGGILVGIAVCIKVTPLVFLIYFLWKRQWSVTGGIIGGLILGLLLLPAAIFGWHQNLLWLREWTRIMIVPYLQGGHLTYFVGQSIPVFISRLIRHVPAFPMHPNQLHPPHYVNVINLPAPVSDMIIRIVLLAIGVVGLWWSRQRLPTLRHRQYVLEIGGVAAFMLWASPRTWVPHFVTLILTLAAAGMILSDPLRPYITRRRALIALSVAAFLMFLTTDVGKLFGPDGHRWLLTISVSLWASVLLMLVIFTARPQEKEIHPATPDGVSRTI